MNMNISIARSRDLQRRMRLLHPGIDAYRVYIERELELRRELTNAFGRVAQFYGWWSTERDEIVRKGLAFVPQSSVGDYLNTLWLLLEADEEYQYSSIEVLTQTHDDLLFQHEDSDTELLYRLLDKYGRVNMTIRGRPNCWIGHDTKTGNNWKDVS